VNAPNVVRALKTPLLPYYSDDFMRPSIVNFDWMPDGQALVVESWDQEKYSPSLWRVNLNDGNGIWIQDKARKYRSTPPSNPCT